VTLRLVRTAAEFTEVTDRARAGGLTVGLVPTMGALHLGHRSLVERASAECGFVAVTIFVNPLQFDDPADLDAYPRDLEADLALLADAGADVVFAPAVSEIYPERRPADGSAADGSAADGSAADGSAVSGTTVHVAGLTTMLEGKFRQGHFDGVATVVTKLFSLAGRCRAYFGEKDFQQVAVVSTLVRDLCLPVEVVACPTVRELDGLAVSSRNVRLGASDRTRAAVLHRALVAGATAVSAGVDRPEKVREIMLGVLASEPAVAPEYAEVVDPGDLTTPDMLTGEVRLLIAARVGPVRLIDNLGALVGSRFGRDLQLFSTARDPATVPVTAPAAATATVPATAPAAATATIPASATSPASATTTFARHATTSKPSKRHSTTSTRRAATSKER
jgi:pantoate--beta-alanine ligase